MCTLGAVQILLTVWPCALLELLCNIQPLCSAFGAYDAASAHVHIQKDKWQALCIEHAYGQMVNFHVHVHNQ